MYTIEPTTDFRRPGGVGISDNLAAWLPRSVRICWINHSRLTRDCMTDVVARARPTFTITSFGTASDCIAFAIQPLDLIIYHAQAQGVTDLGELTELRTGLPNVKILVLSDSVALEAALIKWILAEGTVGLLLTNSGGLDMLLSAIHLVGSGGTFVSKEFFMATRLPERSPEKAEGRGGVRITQRERSVLELIKSGKPNKVIAQELGLSVFTVKVHARNLIRKMGVANRTQAATIAGRYL